MVEQDLRGAWQTCRGCRDDGFVGIAALDALGGEGSDDGDRAVFVARVVLQDERRTCLLHFVSFGGVQAHEPQLAALYCFGHGASTASHSFVTCRSRAAF